MGGPKNYPRQPAQQLARAGITFSGFAGHCAGDRNQSKHKDQSPSK
jgi:hypothetical protein